MATVYGADAASLSEPVVRLRIDRYAMTRAEPESPDRVIFDPDAVRGAIEIVLSPMARTSHTLPAEAWWESVKWQIERLPIASEEFEADERDLRALIRIGGSPTRQIGPGESIRADFVSEGWPTGVYRVKISLGEIVPPAYADGALDSPAFYAGSSNRNTRPRRLRTEALRSQGVGSWRDGGKAGTSIRTCCVNVWCGRRAPPYGGACETAGGHAHP